MSAFSKNLKKKDPIKVYLGEFPDFLSVQKRMRKVWQHQKNVSYYLYGSKMHMMTNLFQKKSYPFYKFGELLYLKNIPFETWLPYIQHCTAEERPNNQRVD